MLTQSPTSVSVWTEVGRDDRAAAVGFGAREGGAFDILIESASNALTFVTLRWADALPAGARILGDHWERAYGDLEWRGVVPERSLPWYALLYDPKTGGTRGVGVETGAASLASWRVDETGLTLVLDVRCGGLGVRLGGRRLMAATVRDLASVAGESAFAFARRFCAALCPAPRLPAGPIYGGNDWYSRYGHITADTVRSDAALIRELSPCSDVLPFSVIDAGWYPTHTDEGGVYDRGNAGFPDMAGLAAQMRGSGVRPGIWIRPLLTYGDDVPASWRVGPAHPLAKTPDARLDPSVPDVLERVHADIKRLTDWGYELIKHDFSTYDMLGRWGLAMKPDVTVPGWAFSDRTKTTAEIINALYATIRDAAGDAQIIGCNTVSHLSAGVFEMQRTGDDTSGYQWERTRVMGPNSLAFRMPQQGTFYTADADCVGLRTDIPWDLNAQWLDLLSRSGTAVFVSAHPDAAGPEQRAALREAFARAALPNPPAEPLDWMDTTAPRRWRAGTETFTYDWQPFPGSSFACP